MPGQRVLIGPAPMRHLEHVWGPPLKAAGLECVMPEQKAQMTEAELLPQLRGCVAALGGSEPYTRKVLTDAKAHGLKIVARAGVGFDSVDVAAATELGIVIGYGPGSNQDAVAEHMYGFLLALAKNLIPQHVGTAAGNWPRKATKPVRGTTLGIVGVGRVGKAVARRAKAFGLKLIATEPVPDHAFMKEQGIELMPLEQLLATADWVSLHCPLAPDTRQMINAKTLALMKPTAHLINTSRGEVVDEKAVTDALLTGKIAGAALDVFEDEPMLANHPLSKLPNVILTAHTAGVDTASLEAMARFAAECIADYLSGKWPAERIVNGEVKRFLKH